MDWRRFSVETTLSKSQKEQVRWDKGSVENNKEGVLCGSNDMVRATSDKMRKLFGAQLKTSGATRERVTSCVTCRQSVCVCTCNVGRCSVHTPIDCLGAESCREAKNNYLKKRKDFVGITSCCEVTGFPVLISTLKFLLFSPGRKSPIIPTLMRLPFIVLLPLRG